MTTQPTGAAELPEALTEDQWLDLAQRHAMADWNSDEADGYLNAIKAVCVDYAAQVSALSAAQTEALKDHQIAALVNELRDIAIKYHSTQQLRERIAHAVTPLAKATQALSAAQAGVPADVAALVRAAQAFVLEPESYKKKLELEALAWGPLAAAPQPSPSPALAFQQRVQPWLLECFGAEIAADRTERNHRFLEESLELVQALGCTASEAHQLVDYVFGRPVGDPPQEVGGVMVTLAALCLANDLDMHDAGEVELARISAPELVAKIRAKQAAKPKHSPLPQSPTPQADSQPAPVDMVLHCPKCGVQHIDASEPPVEFEPGAAQWNNPPHRSHLCHGCGHIWRPADVPTNGVAAVKTTGKADSPIAARAPADSVTAPAGGAVAGPGWQMVPVKPTPEMLRAGDQKTWVLPALDCWRAMLAAAPAPPAQAADSVLEDAALSSEQQRAILEAYESAASESYFEVRPQIDCSDRRRVFKAGYERGWDAARKQGGAT